MFNAYCIMKTVGIIGGGAAGLCAARHVLATSNMVPVVWEKSSKVGGTWVYTPQVGKDENGLPIHSSMYKNLKTNLPKEIMAFPDYPFPEGKESFLHHTEVCKYLENYAENFKLHSNIKFKHHVEKVSPIMKEEGPPAWEVTVKNLTHQSTSTTICDALLVCNGHYSIPKYPAIKDIEKFTGRKIHSHDYREPTSFAGRKVVILGAGASGLDICLELATVAKKVFLSHNHPVNIPSELPSNIEQVRGVVAAVENGFLLPNETFIEADIILYCTGYEFTFPFLSEECGIRVEDNIVKPLYKHLIHSTYPSMAFIGIPFQVVPFPMFDFQVQFFLKSFDGIIKLPSKSNMDLVTESELNEKCQSGVAIRHYHKFGSLQWVYNNSLANITEIPCLPSVKEKIYQAVSHHRRHFLPVYKKASYRITNKEDFERIN